MKYIIVESIEDSNHKRTAIFKARNDIEEIAKKCGYKVIDIPRINNKIAFSHRTHFAVYRNWINHLPMMKKGDEVIIQLPLRQHTLLLPLILKKFKNMGVRVYGLIHDFDILRLSASNECPFDERIRRYIEEKRTLSLCDVIIAHNNSMKEKLKEIGYKEKRIVDLEIFDYLSTEKVKHRNFEKSVIIAGNLQIKKAGYVYNLPSGVKYNLYGVNYTGEKKDFICYNGAFSSEELANVVEGSFGLVWDGERIDTCAGAFGEYLRINNPHKTSFYLSCGIPVLIWKEAALADFIRQNECGILIDSLEDIPKILEEMTYYDYQKIIENTVKVAMRIRDGYYTKKAIHLAEKV